MVAKSESPVENGGQHPTICLRVPSGCWCRISQPSTVCATWCFVLSEFPARRHGNKCIRNRMARTMRLTLVAYIRIRINGGFMVLQCGNKPCFVCIIE
jgi:hypothetical protein